MTVINLFSSVYRYNVEKVNINDEDFLINFFIRLKSIIYLCE